MDLEELLKVKDNTSENGDDEYFEFQNTNSYDKRKKKTDLSFKPYSCFYGYENQKNR